MDHQVFFVVENFEREPQKICTVYALIYKTGILFYATIKDIGQHLDFYDRIGIIDAGTFSLRPYRDFSRPV